MTTKPTKPTTTATPMHRHAAAATTSTTPPPTIAGRHELRVMPGQTLTRNLINYRRLSNRAAIPTIMNLGPADVHVRCVSPQLGTGEADVARGGVLELPQGGRVIHVDVIPGTGKFAEVVFEDYTG
jgi:hypothetical protein